MTIYTFNLLVGFETQWGRCCTSLSGKDAPGTRSSSEVCLPTTWPPRKNWPITSHWGTGMRELLLLILAFTDQQTTVPQKTGRPCKWSFN